MRYRVTKKMVETAVIDFGDLPAPLVEEYATKIANFENEHTYGLQDFNSTWIDGEVTVEPVNGKSK